MSSIEEVKHLQIPLQAISLATNGFADENLIRKGGFGKVYKGESKEHSRIAIKRLDRRQRQGEHEFKTEIALLSEYKHENIVSLLGFCDGDGEKILVYKYESNGSLDKHLNNNNLTWIQRLNICLDVARGLQYLHDDVGPQRRILHRDVKSSNILLDENRKAKVSDFGLSKIGPAITQSFLITNPCGTPGYVDPEFTNTGHLTQKSDVYSFGVVLFEVLCGRLTRVASYKDDRRFLTVLAQKHYKRKTLDRIVPSYLHKQINATSLTTFSNVAYECLKNGEERPTMKQIVEQLQKALADQLKHVLWYLLIFLIVLCMYLKKSISWRSFWKQPLYYLGWAESKTPTPLRSIVNDNSSDVVIFIPNMYAWDQKLSEAKTQGKIVIANFTASWCDVSPNYIKLSKKQPSLMFLTINAKNLNILSRKWNLKVIPTFIFLRDGQQIDKLEGANYRKLEKKIKTMVDSQVRQDQRRVDWVHHDHGFDHINMMHHMSHNNTFGV